MIFTLIMAILAIAGMFFCIFKFPILKIHEVAVDTFWIPIFLVAILLLITPSFDKSNLWNILISNSTMNPLKIVALFICVSMISIALDETGFFRYIASIFIDKYKASQMKLFIILYILISILTVFTSNDIVILTFTPFILYFSKRGNINPIPYLVMEFTAANTWSMVLSIGNPTNIYLSSVFGLSFLEYFVKMILPAALCGITSAIVLYFLFRKDLKKPIETFSFEKAKIENKPLCILAAIHLFLTTVLLAISNYIHLEMWIICVCFASSILLIFLIYGCMKKKYRYIRGVVRRAPYSLVPFILSMFTIIMALDSYSIFQSFGDVLANCNDRFEPILYLFASTISCNIVNNIPMTMMFGSILNGRENLLLVYATIIGSNLGAILTPVGALAGIMWTRILKQNDIEYPLKSYIKNGAIQTVFLLLAGSISLLLLGI